MSIAPASESTPSAAARAQASSFMADPASFFGMSLTRMHSIPRAELESLQSTALSIRFDEQYERIPMVRKMADGQGIRRVQEIGAVVPLLFQHTMYKSYPTSLLGSRRFDQLTRWFDKLTSADLSKVDASRVESIDEWLDLLAEQTEMDPFATSGSTGTMSFIPRLKRGIKRMLKLNRVLDLQTFGSPPTADSLSGLYHIIWPTFADGHLASFRVGQYLKESLGGGRDDHLHALYPERGSTDLMWLAAQLRAATARGDASRVEVPKNLLDRRAELERQQANAIPHQMAFIEELAERTQGCRVYCNYPSYPLYQVAARGLERGVSCRFAAGSFIGSAGGAKGMPLPVDWSEQVARFFDVPRVERFYGMSEIAAHFKLCTHDRYHIQPWIICFLLDPESGKPLARNGVKKGRAAFFDLISEGHWGGLITGDEIEVDFDSLCACGQSTVHMASQIERYSQKSGGDDKINCAAAPQALAEALDYLVTSR